jgi:NAD(P)-dependent dehydrogenase (short-subunit alcohol dehydrogenase family)
VSDVAKDTFTAEGWPSNTYGVSKIAVNALTRIVAREEAKNTSRYDTRHTTRARNY